MNICEFECLNVISMNWNIEVEFECEIKIKRDFIESNEINL